MVRSAMGAIMDRDNGSVTSKTVSVLIKLKHFILEAYISLCIRGTHGGEGSHFPSVLSFLAFLFTRIVILRFFSSSVWFSALLPRTLTALLFISITNRLSPSPSLRLCFTLCSLLITTPRAGNSRSTGPLQQAQAP